MQRGSVGRHGSTVATYHPIVHLTCSVLHSPFDELNQYNVEVKTVSIEAPKTSMEWWWFALRRAALQTITMEKPMYT